MKTKVLLRTVPILLVLSVLAVMGEEAAAQTQGEPAGIIPPTPTLYAIYNEDGDGNYVIEWSSCGEAFYDIEEATNETFDPLTETYETGNTAWEVHNKPPGTYYYRIRAWQNGVPGAYSNVKSVTVIGGEDTAVYVSPPEATTSVRTPIVLGVNAANVTDLGSFGFSLSYNPALVSVQDIALGDFASSSGRSFTALGPTIDNTAGTATFGAYSLGSTPPGAVGSGVLAHVHFLPLADGLTELHLLDVQVTTVAGESIPVVVHGGTLNVLLCPGDMDGDADVDIVDVQSIAYRWNSSSGDELYDPHYDTDGDGDIDIVDVQQVAYHWGTTCSAAY